MMTACEFAQRCCPNLYIYAAIWGESLSCGYQLPKHRWSVCSCRSYLPSSVHSQPYMLPDTDGQTHRNKWTQTPTNANPLVHIRYTIFPSCFSSTFPNGWLNQLCGAPFKSSGMLGHCQRPARERRGNKVTGGEQLTSSSTFIKTCFNRDKSMQPRELLNHPTITHTQTVVSTLPWDLWEHRQYSSINILWHTKWQAESPHLQKPIVIICAHKPNGEFNKAKLQSTLQPHYEEEMLHEDKVRILRVFSSSLLRNSC